MIKYIIILALVILLIFLLTFLKFNENFSNEITDFKNIESDYKKFFNNTETDNDKLNLNFIRKYKEIDNLNDFNINYFLNTRFKLESKKFKDFDESKDIGIIRTYIKLYKDKEMKMKDLEVLVNKIWDENDISKNPDYNNYNLRNKELYIFIKTIKQDNKDVIDNESYTSDYKKLINNLSENELYLYYDYSILNNLYNDFKVKKTYNNENYTFCKYFISQKLDFELKKFLFIEEEMEKTTLDALKIPVINRTYYGTVNFEQPSKDITINKSVINDILLKYRIKDYKDNFEFLLNYTTEKSLHSIWLHCNILFDTITTTVNIISIKIIGSKINNVSYKNKLNQTKNTDSSDIHCSISTSKECKTPKNFDLNNQSLIKNEKYMCINRLADNKEDCIAEDGNKNKGVWDKPCKKNEECPFYKANKNYDNEFGGCINGYCEFPINMKNISFTKAENEPVCYNCKYKANCVGINCNLCCEDQKDKNLYPNLLSPDYAFKQDYYVRNKENIKKQLLNKQLSSDFNININ